MLTEAETKGIEKEAELVDFSNHAPDAHEAELMIIGYIAGATRMAEKKNLEIEASNVSIKIWKNTAGEFKKYNDDLKAQLEAAQEELEKEKKSHVQLSEMYQTALHKYVERGAELSRVKEVAEKMAEILKNDCSTTDGSQLDYKIKNTLTEFANLMNKDK